MNIAHVFSHFNIGGAQTMLSDIMNVQIRTCKVTLFVLLDDVNKELLESLDKRIKVVQLKRKKGSWNYFPYLKLNAMLFWGNYDIVHLHEKTIWKHIFFPPWVNLFQTVHNTEIFSQDFHRCKKIFAISKTVEDGLLKHGFKNVVLAPNGINPSLIKKAENEHKDWRQSFRMVQVSRLIIEHKGQDLILKAMKKLKDNGLMPESMTMEFIGDGKDETLLKEMVLKYGLANHVKFLGLKTRDYVYNHLKDYDLFIQPSRYEGFGLTVAEAMAAGIPVLVSNNEGPFEIIGEGKFGYWFKNGNIEDLSNKLYYIYKNYSETIMKSISAYASVKENYNVEKTVQIYLENYGC